jgi:HEAT repeat protein
LYTEQNAHYIRWAAVRAIFYLDPIAAKEFLLNAASDKHPHVRKAATQTLSSTTKKMEVPN